MKRTAKFCMAVVLILVANIASGQENSSKQPVTAGHFYRLLFQLEELDGEGKVVNTRAYTTTVSTAETRPASIRSGDRIPVTTTTGKGDITYLDVGFRMDALEVVERENKLQLNVTATLSSVASPATNPLDPVIRQNTWSGNVIVPIGKATVIFLSDNLENKGETRVELTATRID